jgi:ATP synthase protein I
MNDQPDASHDQYDGGESLVWSIVGTLLAGPTVYGLIGYGVDRLADTSAGLPIGIVIGFVLSGYIIYKRYGRD